MAPLQLGGLAIDVYEQEARFFFRDLSSQIIADDVIQRLISFPTCDRNRSSGVSHPRSLDDHLRNHVGKRVRFRGGTAVNQRNLPRISAHLQFGKNMMRSP